MTEGQDGAGYRDPALVSGVPGTDALALLARAYRDHRTAVHSVAMRLCGSSAADDITQEVFIKLWHQPERFNPARGSLRPFLVTITHHMAVDHLRSRSARSRREVRSERRSGDEATEVDAQALQQERKGRVVAAIERLPPKEREAIVIAFYGNCTYREAADVLNQPEGTIKARIRAALKHLAPSLRDLQPDL